MCVSDCVCVLACACVCACTCSLELRARYELTCCKVTYTQTQTQTHTQTHTHTHTRIHTHTNTHRPSRSASPAAAPPHHTRGTSMLTDARAQMLAHSSLYAINALFACHQRSLCLRASIHVTCPPSKENWLRPCGSLATLAKRAPASARAHASSDTVTVPRHAGSPLVRRRKHSCSPAASGTRRSPCDCWFQHRSQMLPSTHTSSSHRGFPHHDKSMPPLMAGASSPDEISCAFCSIPLSTRSLGTHGRHESASRHCRTSRA